MIDPVKDRTMVLSRVPARNKVGARSRHSHDPARSGRPALDTIARIAVGRSAASRSAAAAPVPELKQPMFRPVSVGWRAIQFVIAEMRRESSA